MELVDSSAEPDVALPLQCHPAFARALAAMGRTARALTIRINATSQAHLVMVGGRFAGLACALVIRGPVWSPATPPELRVRALRHLRTFGIRLVESDDSDPALRAAGFRQVVTRAHVAELDLTPATATCHRTLAPDWRNKLAKARRASLTLTTDSFDPFRHRWFLDAEMQQRRERRYRTLPTAFVTAYARANPGQAQVYSAQCDGAPVAAMLMLRHGPTATYHLGWTGPRGRATAAHQLLLTYAAERLAEQGHTRLDLGTIDTDANPGLARFKIGAGATIRALGGSWIAIPGL